MCTLWVITVAASWGLSYGKHLEQHPILNLTKTADINRPAMQQTSECLCKPGACTPAWEDSPYEWAPEQYQDQREAIGLSKHCNSQELKYEGSPPKSKALHSQSKTLLCSLPLVPTDPVWSPLITTSTRVQKRTQLGKKAKATSTTHTSQPSPPI